MNIKIIVNPRAGNGQARETGYEVEKYLCERGIEYSLDSTFRPKGAISLTKKAVEEGFELIIAVGGDGTVNEVANGMMGSKSTLAVIPAGNENNFSKMLGLSSNDLKEACETALYGVKKQIDAGKINDKYFLNGIGIGLGAEIHGKKRIFPGIRGKKGYLINLFSALTKFRSQKLNIKMGTVNLDTNVLFTKISNGKFVGGGVQISPNADMEDGLFDVCVLNDIGKMRFLFNLPRLIGNRQHKIHPLNIFRTDEIQINSHSPIKIVYDGEELENSSYSIKIAESKISVKSK